MKNLFLLALVCFLAACSKKEETSSTNLFDSSKLSSGQGIVSCIGSGEFNFELKADTHNAKSFLNSAYNSAIVEDIYYENGVPKLRVDVSFNAIIGVGDFNSSNLQPDANINISVYDFSNGIFYSSRYLDNSGNPIDNYKLTITKKSGNSFEGTFSSIKLKHETQNKIIEIKSGQFAFNMRR